MGTHDGIINYTIGQRKGIKISNPNPLYVIDIRAKDNSIIVGTQDYLNIKKLYLRDVNVLSNIENFKKNIFIKVRSTGKLLDAKVKLENNSATVNILQDEKGISHTKHVYFIQKISSEKEFCGGWIKKTEVKIIHVINRLINKTTRK